MSDHEDDKEQHSSGENVGEVTAAVAAGEGATAEDEEMTFDPSLEVSTKRKKKREERKERTKKKEEERGGKKKKKKRNKIILYHSQRKQVGEIKIGACFSFIYREPSSSFIFKLKDLDLNQARIRKITGFANMSNLKVGEKEKERKKERERERERESVCVLRGGRTRSRMKGKQK